MTYNYPKVRKEDLVEEKFGIPVADPYRWLEDENSPETAQFVDDQIAFTETYLEQIEERPAIKEDFRNLMTYETYGAPWVHKDMILYSYNPGDQNQASWYLQKGLEGEARKILDPNILSEEGTVAISPIAFSKDDQYLTYLVSESGSDWSVIRILDLETGEDLEDELAWVKFTGTHWDENGFYYSAYPAPQAGEELSAVSEYEGVYYHRLGQAQEEDDLVFEDLDHPLRYHTFTMSKDTDQKMVLASEGTYGNDVLLYNEEIEDFESLFQDLDADRYFLAKYEGQLLFYTDDQAPNRKIISLDPETGQVEDLVAETDHVLQNAELVGDVLILDYGVDVVSQLKRVNLKTGEEELIETGDLSNVATLSGSKELGGFIYTQTTLQAPLTSYFYDLETGDRQVFKSTDLPLDTSDFVVERHFVDASDGAKVPLFVMYKEGLVKDGSNPTLLYAYGGFNISTDLSYSTMAAYLVENGGVYAQANIRGGSEYGEDWHQQGMRLNKQRVFDDFIESAEYLIDQGFTSSDRLAIDGASNGGLLVGAVLNQRPDLYRVAFPRVGVMDMLRYAKFTVGWGWVGEFGDPEEEVHFKNILKYSPYHNIQAQDYPSVMVCTADHDDRVVPAHSFKYGARLQELNTSDRPILMRIDKDAGHGAGRSTEKIIEEMTDRYAFLVHEMGL